ncbi:MAG: ATP-dependent zinc metalloprotease FtsH [Spirochaetaceae bacterium]|jgi:cell division protease FtsH|nr:ATP-dependent zinc metalloprotease FtsH [Spirochaetaceae bacterium]
MAEGGDDNSRRNAPPGKNRGSVNPSGRAGFLFFVGAIIFFVLFMMLGVGGNSVPEMSYSRFIASVKNDEVLMVRIVDNQEIQISFANGTSYKTYIPYTDEDLIPLLEAHKVVMSGGVSSPSLLGYILQFLPLLVTIIFVVVIFRQMSGQNVRAQQFSRSRARRSDIGSSCTFADVAGQEEAKTELREVVEYLKNPRKFVEMGAKIPKGVLLVGSPGTGKTLLARAVAGEAGVAFFHISGSDFVEMFVGVGASRVRDLFDQGRRHAPCIIFIDELDAVGRARGTGYGGGHDEREQTLNQMLVEMDGFDTKSGVIVLAATNRPDVLDPALLRPGRFDRQVMVSLPDIREREAIIAVHAKKIPLALDVDMKRLARSTVGLSGADLANMVNEAALFAARTDKKQVDITDFENARDKILLGTARTSMVLSDRERQMTAVHEAGHALPYYYLDNVHPLHKVTVIPRGRALGLTVGLPKEDVHSSTRNWLLDQLVIMFGGYAAETVVYADVTTGTQNDIRRATDIARRMVCEWGMSDELGAVAFGQEDEPIFLGKEIARHKDYSENTAMRIDSAIRTILEEAKNRALSILTEHRSELDILSSALVERETLDDADIRALLGFAAAEGPLTEEA